MELVEIVAMGQTLRSFIKTAAIPPEPNWGGGNQCLTYVHWGPGLIDARSQGVTAHPDHHDFCGGNGWNGALTWDCPHPSSTTTLVLDILMALGDTINGAFP